MGAVLRRTFVANKMTQHSANHCNNKEAHRVCVGVRLEAAPVLYPHFYILTLTYNEHAKLNNTPCSCPKTAKLLVFANKLFAIVVC